MELAGRTALVTGATSDIGAAIVRSLARRGASVAVHCHRNVARAEAVAADARALGVGARVFQGDLSHCAPV